MPRTLSAPELAAVQLIRSHLLNWPYRPGQPVPPIVDWKVATSVALQHGLAPLLYQALTTRAQRDVPTAVVQSLRTAYLQTSTANARMYAELAHLLEVFGHENIPIVLLKGSALAATLYVDPGLRPMGDLDLLVPVMMLDRSTALLEQEGYIDGSQTLLPHIDRHNNEILYYRPGNWACTVDLHWRLLGWVHYTRSIPIEWFWERTTEQPIAGQPAKVLDPEAHLLHAAAHLALHHAAERLVWSLDMALLIDRYQDQINWTSFIDAVRAFGLAPAVQQSIARVEETWGVSLPEPTRSVLFALASHWSERMILSFARSPRKWHHNVDGVFARPGWQAKLAYIIGILFPNATYMQSKYNIRNLRLLPLYYAWRPWAAIARAVQAIWELSKNAIRLAR